jgi:hypothetical protein
MICSCKYLLSDLGPSVMLYFCCAQQVEEASRTASVANTTCKDFMESLPFKVVPLVEKPTAELRRWTGQFGCGGCLEATNYAEWSMKTPGSRTTRLKLKEWSRVWL